MTFTKVTCRRYTLWGERSPVPATRNGGADSRASTCARSAPVASHAGRDRAGREPRPQRRGFRAEFLRSVPRVEVGVAVTGVSGRTARPTSPVDTATQAVAPVRPPVRCGDGGGPNPFDDILGRRSDVPLRRGQMRVAEDPLNVAIGINVTGEPVGGRVPKIVQGPVGAQRRVRAGEHRPRGVVGQRTERPSQRPPQRVIGPRRDQPAHLLLVEPQPHERVRGSRHLLQRP